MSVSLAKSTGHAVVTHFVGGWESDPVKMGIPARVFGLLADRAACVTTHYRSDMFHDAMWLNEHVTPLGDGEALTFYYVTRAWGTHLVQTSEWVDAVVAGWPDAQVYTMALTCERGGAWHLYVSRSR